MFQGSTSLSLDDKGRMVVPTRQRDGLLQAGDGHLILTVHPHRCLLLYPRPAWEPIRDRILAVPDFHPGSAAAKRVLVGNAREADPDAAGRILIASDIREQVGLDKQVWFVGVGSHYEIWSDAGWRRQHETAAEVLSGNEMPPGFEGIAL